MEQNNNIKNNFKIKSDGKNPIGNLGGLFLKIGKKSDYYVMKLDVRGENMTFVCFPNPNKDFNDPDSLYGREPTHYIFPYKPKNKNKEENYNE